MDEVWDGPVADSFESHPVLARHQRFHGAVWDVRSDEVQIGDHRVVRDLVVHPGAVGVIALDDQDRILLIRQYRHPVAAFLFEPPAGLLDTHKETAWDCAQRELAEEAGLRADDWHVLIDFLNSPGGTSETLRCFLARGLHPLEGGREHTGEAEEAHLPQAWLPLDEAVVLREGDDVTLVTWGAMVHDTLRAADLLMQEKVSCEVIDLSSLSPIDHDTILESVAHTARLVIVHEAARNIGLGAEIAATVAEKALYDLLAPVVRVTGYDTVMPYFALERSYIPSVARIVDAAKQTMQG